MLLAERVPCKRWDEKIYIIDIFNSMSIFSVNQYMRSLHYSITSYTNCQSDKCCSDIDYQYYCHLESFSLEFFKLFIV